VQLVGGAHRCEGRVEVEHNGQWGTVCDDGWDRRDVAVVCRELNCGAVIQTPRGASYQPPASEQRVLIQGVDCNGTEDTLAQCELNYDVFDCSHEEDAGAQCESKYERLKGHFLVSYAPDGHFASLWFLPWTFTQFYDDSNTILSLYMLHVLDCKTWI
jgi:hypothetical protein